MDADATTNRLTLREAMQAVDRRAVGGELLLGVFHLMLSPVKFFTHRASVE